MYLVKGYDEPNKRGKRKTYPEFDGSVRHLRHNKAVAPHKFGQAFVCRKPYASKKERASPLIRLKSASGSIPKKSEPIRVLDARVSRRRL